jgi:hypothetical protein
MTTDLPMRRTFPASNKFFCVEAVLALGLLVGTTCARGQAIPAAEASPISTGFSIPTVGGSLRYAVSASESLDWGYYTQSGVASGTNLSGDLAYLSESKFHPFSMVLSGGRTLGLNGEPSYGFASLALSQVFNVKRWNFVIADSVSYLPNTATGGISGVPGLGDLGVSPVQVGTSAGQGILTNYSPEVNNTATASVQRQLTSRTAINASGSYSILRFVNGVGSSGGFGLQSDTVTGSAGFTHRLSARNTYGGNYAYSRTIFVRNHFQGIPTPNFESHTASFTYSHQFNRRLELDLAAGPEWVKLNSSNSTGLSAYADASLGYSTLLGHMGLSYVRSTNSGWGVVAGALSDAVTFHASRLYGRVWEASANASWTHTVGLPTPNTPTYDLQTEVAGFQLSRALARSLSGYVSYIAENQSHASTNGTTDLFNGLNHVIGFGVTYSPMPRRFGR